MTIMPEHYTPSEYSGQDPEQWRPEYHDFYERSTSPELISQFYRRIYTAIYSSAYKMIEATGRHPLENPEARALLCGTATSETTLAFASFVHQHNPESLITAIDLHQKPLKNSQQKIENNPKLDNDLIAFAQADAAKLPFTSDSFSLIETDYFLQFFEPELRRSVIAEWARVMQPEGAVMTREILPETPRAIDWNERRIAKFAKQYGITVHCIKTEDLLDDFAAAGLEASLRDFVVGPIKLPIKQIIAVQPIKQS